MLADLMLHPGMLFEGVLTGFSGMPGCFMTQKPKHQYPNILMSMQLLWNGFKRVIFLLKGTIFWTKLSMQPKRLIDSLKLLIHTTERCTNLEFYQQANHYCHATINK